MSAAARTGIAAGGAAGQLDEDRCLQDPGEVAEARPGIDRRTSP